ncbi:MAG: class I SAM-dependent methyltransferase [Minisyncoccota bacterium]
MYIFQPDRYLLDKQIRKFSHYIKGKVLDVGAGEVNRYGKYFKSDEYIKMDPRHVSHADLVGSADNIPLEAESIDSVVCTQVFEHLENPQKSAEEIYRVLKKGGYVLLTVPQMNELHEEPYDFFRYTKFGLKLMFEKVGFEVVEIDQRGGYYSTLAQMRIRHAIDKYSLYKNKFLGKIFAPICKVYGRVAVWLDGLDTSVSNTKHTIGWCIVLKK